MRGFGKAVLKSLLATLIFFGVGELGLRAAYAARNAAVHVVPLPYALGDEYGPIPPWLDRLMILMPDDVLIWRSSPHVRRTYLDVFSPAPSAADRVALLRRFRPWPPGEFSHNPTWTIALNSEGFRGTDFETAHHTQVRVACVGDSWTFGMNVDQDRTYPAQLEMRLAAAHPKTTYEVMNFGVLGYSSFQGLQLLSHRVLALHPDIVVIGFGMNDSEVAGYRDKDVIATKAAPLTRRMKDAVTDGAKDLETYKLLKYSALALKFRPKSIGEYLKADAEAGRGSGVVDYDAIEPWTRVSPQDYERNLREMIGLATAAGARVVLVDNELWGESPYRPVLRRLSAAFDVPLVDSYRLVADAQTKAARDFEVALKLDPSAAGDGEGPPSRPATSTTVVFRVRQGDRPVPSAISIVGSDRQLGDLTPNTVHMHDDGRLGDQRAGDGVWSYAASFAPGARLSYVYTNSGAQGRWEGLDVPHIRHLVVPSSADGLPVYLPIETFGKVYMQADDWHTDASGYDLIASAVADAIGK
jgi:lysophospholipase L1-like esterase